MANALAASTSPYLLQHADNPVNWVEWGPEAFTEARERDVPILLSIGYAACHWCHVMAHESFEDDATAESMNAHFVCIKVDREERPDVDSVYMEATQAMTGHGGWPMTVFMTPDGAPFYCGTYFPPAPARGMPSFRQLLDAVYEAWTDRRDDVLESGKRIAERLRGRRSFGDPAPVDADALDAAVDALWRSFEPEHGGFERAPKFPPSMVLDFLLRHYARTEDPRALTMVETTCERMARGGIYDQLAGGFARYSVDAQWVVPHFEKMLYDNALLLGVYLHLWRETGSTLARRVADETATFLIRGLGTPEGGFASALDADTDGVEGLTYSWTPQQLVEVLGADDGAWAATLLNVTQEGTFEPGEIRNGVREQGSSVLELLEDPDDQQRWAEVRRALLTARAARPQPGRDDKVVTAWNGLAIAALSEHAMLTDSAESLSAAIAAAELVTRLHLVDGKLRRVSRDGVVGRHGGVLEDYAELARGLLALHQASADGRWLDLAGELLEAVPARFSDSDGGFFDTPDDGEPLIRRPQDPTDGPAPSGAAAACDALITYAALTGKARSRALGEGALASLAPIIARAPRAAGAAAGTAEALLAGPLEIAVAGSAGSERAALAAVVRAGTSPGAVSVVGEPDAPGVPLLAGRVTPQTPVAVFICQGFVCRAPLSDVSAVGEAVRARKGNRLGARYASV
ncbi:MAG: thioredoxin domain-containing protein [Actinomycetota bacterium]|nr:thioredoxin domain-containing protein [Actinomycetota bacterium]